MTGGTPYPTPEPRTLALAAGRVVYTDQGSGPPLVALHGLPGSWRDFRWLAPSLTQSHRLICVGLPGFGGSDAGLCAPTRADHHRFLDTLFDALDLEDVVLVGHSFGGLLAWCHAAHAPARVRGLVLLAPAGVREHKVARNTVGAGTLAQILTSPAGRLGPRWLARTVFESLGFPHTPLPEIVRVLESLDAWSWEGLDAVAQAVQAPTFLAACDDDPLVETTITDELSDALPAGLRLRFARGGHLIQRSCREDLAAALVPWLRDLPGPARSGAE